MGTFLPLLCLLVGIAIPLTVLVLMLRRTKHQADAVRAYREVANHLGLEVDTRGLSVQGHLNDQRLWIGEVMTGHGPERRRVHWGVLDMEVPLAMGLVTRRTGLSERVFQRGRGPRRTTGNLLVDKLVDIQGDDPNQVATVFANAEVMASLRSLMARWPNIVITDSNVRVFLQRPETDADGLFSLVESMRRLAAALKHARYSAVLPSSQQAIFLDWQDKLPLKLNEGHPVATGQLEGRTLQLSVVRGEDQFESLLRLYFRPHRERGLRLSPQNTPTGFWSVGQDIEFDDRAFDDAYVVKGWDPQRVKDLVSKDARVVLTELAAFGDVHCDDRRLELRRLSTETDTILHVIALCSRAANALGW